MGFKDILGAGLKYAQETAQQKSAQIEEWKRRYSRFDDDKLKQIYHKETGNRKLAAGILLKERGY